ncbi:MAG: hypothetical protein KAI53_04420 [Candidatus Aenigmarchaeota archaeon]|nr:hypothetical protein [Candidatus Aenigmarchaeota archaeon]
MASQLTLDGSVAEEKAKVPTQTEYSPTNTIAKGAALIVGAYMAQTLFEKRYLNPVADLLQDWVVEIAKLTDQLPATVVAASPMGDELSNAVVSIIAGGFIFYEGAKTINKYIK